MQVRRALIATAASLAFANMANAAIIELSTHSSDATDPSVLLATFEFTISGSTLTLEVSNNTVVPNEYNINEIFWNAPDGVTLTPLAIPSGWSFFTSGVPDTVAGIFGRFDFALTGPVDDGPDVIMPGASEIFTFTISGGSPSEGDFVSQFSDMPPGDMTAIVAAKFVFGPEDPKLPGSGSPDSAYGGTVPSPGSLALLALAGLLAGRRKRRAA